MDEWKILNAQKAQSSKPISQKFGPRHGNCKRNYKVLRKTRDVIYYSIKKFYFVYQKKRKDSNMNKIVEFEIFFKQKLITDSIILNK